MEFRVLGPLEVVADDDPVPIPRQKHRTLLAVLLLHAGEPRSSDRLVEDLWGERPPRAARAALQNNVSQLRQLLGAELILRRPAGYVLEVEDDQLDLARFRRLAGDARTEAHATERARKAREALALWRGPPLADLSYEPFAALELPLLEEERLSVQRALLDDELELGRHSSILPELDVLVRANPYDERLRRQLVLALYRSGRQVDALQELRDARQLYLDELGIEPGRDLRSLEREILEQDPRLDSPVTSLVSGFPGRKTVTVMMAGLPEPEPHLDPEAVHARSRRFFDCVREAVEYNGGTVERAGERVMALFGVPSANEDDSLRAIRAAVLARTTYKGEARFGLETGEVYAAPERGGETVNGGPVIEARRLEQRASPGQILLGIQTLRLARDAVRVAPSRRGRSGPLGAAFRLVALEEPSPDTGRRYDTPLIGRLEQLGRLRRAFDEARNTRHSRLMTVVGEAGIGKTRLARELVAGVRGEATVLVGRCISYGEGATYLPVAEMLTQAGRELESTLGGAASTGAELAALGACFASIARDRPAVLVFEDIHWAEPTLLELIEYLGDRLDEPVLILCLARPAPASGRLIPGTAVPLDRLDDEEILAFVQALDGGFDPAVAAGIVAVAEGNPLYAEQLLAYVREGGAPGSMPASLEALIASRFDRLDMDERRLLQRAAVIGRAFARALLGSLCPPDLAGAIDTLIEGAAEAGFVEISTAGYRFHHVLMRDVAYSSLPKAERAELHERLADAMVSAPDELVGHHLEQAVHARSDLDPADRRIPRLATAAGAHLGAAGLRAWKRGDAPAAVSLLGRAVDLLREDDPYRLELMCELGVALRGAGELRRAESVLATAAEIAGLGRQRRFEARARLELENVRLFSDPGGRAGSLLDVAADAVNIFETVADDHGLARAWRLIAFAEGAMRCRYSASAEAAEQALACERETGWSTAAILGDLGAALFYGPTPVPLAIARCESLLEEADLGGQAVLSLFLADLEAMRERPRVARGYLDRAERLYAELGQSRFAAPVCASHRAEVEMLAANLLAAEAALRTGYSALETMGDRASLATCAAALAEVLLRCGRAAEAATWSTTALELVPDDDVPTQFLTRAVRAKILALEGDCEKAEVLARQAATLSNETDSVSQRADVMLGLADVLRTCGQREPATEAAADSLALYAQKGNLAGARHARNFLDRTAPR